MIPTPIISTRAIKAIRVPIHFPVLLFRLGETYYKAHRYHIIFNKKVRTLQHLLLALIIRIHTQKVCD